MNNKKAKELRRKARMLMEEFIVARVLTPEMYSEATPEQLDKVLPERTLLRKDNILQQAFGTKRWFIRAVKTKPDVTYPEIEEAVYGV